MVISPVALGCIHYVRIRVKGKEPTCFRLHLQLILRFQLLLEVEVGLRPAPLDLGYLAALLAGLDAPLAGALPSAAGAGEGASAALGAGPGEERMLLVLAAVSGWGFGLRLILKGRLKMMQRW